MRVCDGIDRNAHDDIEEIQKYLRDTNVGLQVGKSLNGKILIDFC